MDYDALVIRESRFVRFVRAMGLLVVEEPQEATPGADFAQGVPVSAPYNPRRALSALVASPYFAACVEAISRDLAGLPVIVGRKVKDSEGERIEPVPDHPLAKLIEKPTGDPTVTGRQWRMQVIADRLCAGTAGAVVIRDRSGMPAAMQRMHPARIDIEPSETGGIRTVGYARSMGESQQSYSPETVLLWRNISWADDPTGLYGIGYAQVLDADITAEVELAKSAARQAKKGRPDAVYGPSVEGEVWAPKQVKAMEVQVRNMIRNADGGVAIMSGVGKLQPLGWAPKDMANAEQRTLIRTTCMSLFGVPPIRLGLETANYATAREQLRVYWMGLQARAAEFDEQLTRLGVMFGEPDLVVYTDFSGVAALQEDESERLARVKMHIDNGMSADDAYRYEGLDDAPDIVDPLTEPAQQQPPAQAAKPDGQAEPVKGIDMEALADMVAQARAVQSGDVSDEDAAIEAATLADMVLALAAALAAERPAEAR